MSLEAREVSWTVRGTVIVDGISVEVRPGESVGLLGPNGAGKSSLLQLFAGLRPPSQGTLAVDGRTLADWDRGDLARTIAVVEQQVSTDVDLTVTEVIGLGRIPHRSTWGGMRESDHEAVTRALSLTGLESLAHRRWHSLSGGERQLTQIARALAQDPAHLLLDEPTNHLDVAHQLDIMELVRNLPLTSIIALHDLNLAATFCDEVVVLSGGRVVAAGRPADVLTEDLVREVYHVRCTVTPVEPEGRPHIRFLSHSRK